LRNAGRRYQQSFRGRLHHARRQSRWRERQREKVTHHGFLKIDGDASVGGHEEVDDNARSQMQRAARVGGNGDAAAVWRRPARETSIRGVALRCAWCGVGAAHLVRLQRWQQ
jgi:hypothetical protein